MAKELIFSVVAEDQPGIVERVSATVAKHGGNWMESRMVRMAGKFAGIIRVEAPDDAFGALTAGLSKLNAGGFSVVIDDEFETPGASPGSGLHRRVRFKITANDRPGIVQEVSHCLAELGGNVHELDTDCRSGAMTGHAIFSARVEVELGETVGHETLVSALHDLSDDLMVDVEE